MKKTVYVISAALLGFLLSLLVHAAVETWYLQWLEKRGEDPTWSSLFGAGQCALPNWLNGSIAVIGIVGGLWLGFVWWRIVYIEKRHWRFKKK